MCAAFRSASYIAICTIRKGTTFQRKSSEECHDKRKFTGAVPIVNILYWRSHHACPQNHYAMPAKHTHPSFGGVGAVRDKGSGKLRPDFKQHFHIPCAENISRYPRAAKFHVLFLPNTSAIRAHKLIIDITEVAVRSILRSGCVHGIWRGKFTLASADSSSMRSAAMAPS